MSPIGKLFTHRLVMAAHQSIRYGCGGIRGLQEFLRLSWLEYVVASSERSLEAFSVRYEEHLCAFGTQEGKRLAKKMQKRKITVGLDEMFRGRRPCLVELRLFQVTFF